MILELASLGTEPQRVEARFTADELGLADTGVVVAGAVEFTGEAMREGERARLRGQIDADLTVSCSRCLEPAPLRLEVPFEDIFVDTDEAAPEAEVTGEQLDESPAANGQIDLAEAVREQVMLALPEQTFCREECAGICEKCGTNRNITNCSCRDEDIDPRWQALKKFSEPREGK